MVFVRRACGCTGRLRGTPDCRRGFGLIPVASLVVISDYSRAKKEGFVLFT
jgi:hypothetical protein